MTVEAGDDGADTLDIVHLPAAGCRKVVALMTNPPESVLDVILAAPVPTCTGSGNVVLFQLRRE